MDSSTLLRLEAAHDAAAVDHIHAIAFGPGRFARAAHKLREGVPFDPDLSFVAERDGAVIGTVRLTPIFVDETPALLLGPLAVQPGFMKLGIGSELMRRSMTAARAAGHRVVVLVGDLAFYFPFGFRRTATGAIGMPLPVDPERLLIAELQAGAGAGITGMASPAARNWQDERLVRQVAG